MRISKSELEGALKILRRTHPAADYSLDYSNWGVMLMAGVGGMSEVSRRGTKSEVYEYVWVAIKALQRISRSSREQAE